MTTFKFIVSLIVILLIADFGVRNNAVVPLKYHFGLEGSLPLFVIILVAIFIGFIIAWIAEHLSSMKFKREAKRLKKRNAELEDELESYREKELLEPELGESRGQRLSLGDESDEEEQRKEILP